MKILIGIDPGISGGLSAIYEGGNLAPVAYPCPDTVSEMEIIFYNLYCNLPYGEPVVTIEKQQAFPGQGVSSTYKLGRNMGAWEGIIAARGIPVITVAAGKWMRHFGTMPSDRAERKRHLKEIAQQRFPNLQTGKVTLKTADALLIALYGKEVAWRS